MAAHREEPRPLEKWLIQVRELEAGPSEAQDGAGSASLRARLSLGDTRCKRNLPQQTEKSVAAQTTTIQIEFFQSRLTSVKKNLRSFACRMALDSKHYAKPPLLLRG